MLGLILKRNVQTKSQKTPWRFRLYALITQIHAKTRAVVWASLCFASAGDNEQKEWRREKRYTWIPPETPPVSVETSDTDTLNLSEASGTSACLHQVQPCISSESHTFVEGQMEASSIKKSVSEWKPGMDGLHHWQSFITLELSGFWVDRFLSAPCFVPLILSK